MKQDRDSIINSFTHLATKLARRTYDNHFHDVVGRAVAGNGWFTPAEIVRAIDVISTRMLDRGCLEEWLTAYAWAPVATPKDVGVIMAGNIPLVGFFDLLCVLAAGHRCLYKPSTKDSVLTAYIVDLLREVWPEVPAHPYTGQPIDAIIATGSDNTKRLMRTRYEGIPSLLRGSRSSVAVLDGSESSDELCGLAEDIFTYSGLGCRNVSHLLLPRGYAIERLATVLEQHGAPSAKYMNNYLQRRAVLTLTGAERHEGSFFILRHDSAFPSDISEITYHFYSATHEADEWLTGHDSELQCVVARDAIHPRAVGFGCSQSPTLHDYADGADTMLFLGSI